MPLSQTPQSHPKGKKKVSARALLLTAVSLLIAFLLLVSVIRLAEKHIALRNRIAELKEEHKELEERKKTLGETNAYLATAEGAEQSLRAKFNLVRPGEEIIVITSSPETPKEEEKTVVGRWWESILRGLGIKSAR